VEREGPILKERLFGLAHSEGNHGEDVKEYYFYLDSTPTQPLWVFYRGPGMLTELTELRDKGVAIGPPCSGVRALAEPLLVANKITGSTARLVPLLNREALRALKEGEVDAVAGDPGGAA
jgi:TRAP-type uncharacterized transport system substrate-binding protein